MDDDRAEADEPALPPPATAQLAPEPPPRLIDRWQRTLWAMVGIQFIMTASFSFLSPIMPLFLPELGVTTASGDRYLGRHPHRLDLVRRRVRLAALGPRRRPPRPQADAAAVELRHRACSPR